MNNNYNEYFIKKGKFVGDFEKMYKFCEDPWLQTELKNTESLRDLIVLNWIKKINNIQQNSVSVEIGCGFGFFSNKVMKAEQNCIGIDISETAIRKAKELNPNCKFFVSDIMDFNLYAKHKVDVFFLADITWYILDKLDEFLKKLNTYARLRGRNTYLINTLTTYDKGVQKYGNNFFTDLDSMLRYFNLNYLEYGSIVNNMENAKSAGNYFLAKI